jgi:hypothetical protein
VIQLGEAPRRGKDNLFVQILDRTAKGDLSTLLIIDEAHLIDPQALTDLRLLVSSALDTDLPLRRVAAKGYPPAMKPVSVAPPSTAARRHGPTWHGIAHAAMEGGATSVTTGRSFVARCLSFKTYALRDRMA